jgi:cell division septum initiation protein DivIVA
VQSELTQVKTESSDRQDSNQDLKAQIEQLLKQLERKKESEASLGQQNRTLQNKISSLEAINLTLN